MQAEITFPTRTIKRKTLNSQKILSVGQLIHKFQNFIEDGRWFDRFLGYEKYINRFSWVIICASIFFFLPLCLNIFIR